jgi:hypothetical protein
MLPPPAGGGSIVMSGSAGPVGAAVTHIATAGTGPAR